MRGQGTTNYNRESLACHVFSYEDTAKTTMASDLSSTLSGPDLTTRRLKGLFRRGQSVRIRMARHRYAAFCFWRCACCTPNIVCPSATTPTPPNGILSSCGSSIPPIVNALWSFILLARCGLQHYCGQASGLGSCGRFHLEMQARSNLNIQGSGSAVHFYFSISLCC
jgi:hypothetical protein